jgi:hypothetical protein
MHEWTKVLTNPLGLIGFALFLVFGLFAKLKQRDERRWLFSLAIVMAFIALLGGLGLAYLQIQGTSAAVSTQRSNSAPAPVQQQTNQIQQTSTGPGSPNVQGVQGSVTITVDQSSGKVEEQKAPQRIDKKENKNKTP